MAAASAHKRVLVTGGTGLVGRAIEHVLKEDKHPDEEWFFPSSKEGDLRCALRHLPRFYKTSPFAVWLLSPTPFEICLNSIPRR